MISRRQLFACLWPGPISLAGWRDPRLWAALAIVFRLLTGGWMAWHQSLTVDEPDYAFMGAAFWREGIVHLDTVNPPAARALTSLPWVLAGVPLPDRVEYATAWNTNDHYALGKAFVLQQEPGDVIRTLWFSRIIVLVLSSAALWVLFAWMARSHHGTAGALALWFAAIDPNWLGHSTLATLDVLAGSAMLVGVAMFERTLRRGGWVSASASGVMLGLALAMKLSALVLLPVFAMRLLWNACMRPRGIMKRVVAPGILAALVAFLAIWASYRYETGTIRGAWEASRRDPSRTFEQVIAPRLGDGAVKRFVENQSVPAPTFAVTFLRIRELSQSGKSVVFMGEIHPDGTRWFFPAMLLLKTPLVVIAGIVLLFGAVTKALANLRRRQRSEAILALSPWPFYAVAILLITSLSKNTFAWRYLIPAVPFIAASAAIGCMCRMRRLSPTARRIAVSVLLLLSVPSLLGLPKGIAWFQPFAPRPFYNIAVDSNLDWGQALRELAARRDILDLPGLQGAVYSPAPQLYSIDIKLLEGPTTSLGGPYLLSATEYWGAGTCPDEWIAPLRNGYLRPDEVLCGGAFLYFAKPNLVAR